MDVSIVFARLRLFAPPSLPSDHLSGSAVFAQLTAEGPYTIRGRPFHPYNCLFANGEIWTPSNTCLLGPTPLTHQSSSQTASQSVQPIFAQFMAESSFTMGRPFPPQNCSFAWQDLEHIKYMVPWVHLSPQPKWYLDRFSHFCGAHDRNRQTTRPTDRPRFSVCNNGSQLHK